MPYYNDRKNTLISKLPLNLNLLLLVGKKLSTTYSTLFAPLSFINLERSTRRPGNVTVIMRRVANNVYKLIVGTCLFSDSIVSLERSHSKQADSTK